MDIPTLVAQSARVQRFAAGNHLFRQGDRDPNVYWLASGYMKATYVSPEGRESVKSLLAPSAFVGSLTALDADGSASFNLCAQTDCEVRTIAYAKLRELAAHDHATALAMIDSLLGFARRKERREFELLCLDAPQRYAEALKALADFEGVFSQVDIAAYIGITPQALSRIKRRHQTENTT